VKSKWSSIQLYIHISENSTLYVRRHLFYEFLFVYLFIFLPDNDVIVTVLQYVFDSLLIPFSYEDKRLIQVIALNNTQLTYPLTSGIHD